MLIAEEEARVRRALYFFLKEQPELTIVGETAEVRPLLRLAQVTSPDVILLDWNLPGCIPELLASLRRVNDGLRVIILGRHLDDRPATLAAGADAFICKGDAPQVLQATLQNWNTE